MPKAKEAATQRISFDTAPSKPKRSKAVTTANKAIAIKGLRDLKACRRLRAAILAVETEIDTTAKDLMRTEFVRAGCAKRGRPDNFTGTDEGQQGNCQLRVRIFGAYGVPEDAALDITDMAERADIAEPLIIETETFEFNADVLEDATLRTAIEKALSGIPGLPSNVITKTIKRSLHPDAIQHLFAAQYQAPDFIEESLELVGNLAIRCDYDKTDTNIGPDIDRVAKLFADSKFGDLAKSAAANPEEVLNPRKPTKRKAA